MCMCVCVCVYACVIGQVLKQCMMVIHQAVREDSCVGWRERKKRVKEDREKGMEGERKGWKDTESER